MCESHASYYVEFSLALGLTLKIWMVDKMAGGCPPMLPHALPLCCPHSCEKEPTTGCTGPPGQRQKLSERRGFASQLCRLLFCRRPGKIICVATIHSNIPPRCNMILTLLSPIVQAVAKAFGWKSWGWCFRKV